MPKRCQNNPKVTPKWSRMDPKNSPKSPKMTLFGPKNGPKMTLYSRQVGLKMAQKRSKSTQNTQNQLSIFPDAPLDAHFHRLKRRFWPFFKRSKRFIGEKRGTRLHNIFLRFLGDVAPFFLFKTNAVWEHQCWNRKEKEKEKGSQIWKEKVSMWCVNLIKTSFTSGKKVSPYFFYFFIIIKKCILAH